MSSPCIKISRKDVIAGCQKETDHKGIQVAGGIEAGVAAQVEEGFEQVAAHPTPSGIRCRIRNGEKLSSSLVEQVHAKNSAVA